MAGKPQTLSNSQQEHVIKILRKEVFNGLLILLALLGGILGVSVWQIKAHVEHKMENLVAKQFEEPRIKSTVQEAATTRATELLEKQIEPEVAKFKTEVTAHSGLSPPA